MAAGTKERGMDGAMMLVLQGLALLGIRQVKGWGVDGVVLAWVRGEEERDCLLGMGWDVEGAWEGVSCRREEFGGVGEVGA